MKTRRSISILLKLSKTLELTECLEGALKTYRTIQFSMNNGCCHPKIFSAPQQTSAYRLLSLFLRAYPPLPGDKKSESRFTPANSASQTFVKLREHLNWFHTQLSKTFFNFFSLQAFDSFLRAALTLPIQPAESKSFLTFFSAGFLPPVWQRTGRKQYGFKTQVQEFSEFF